VLDAELTFDPEVLPCPEFWESKNGGVHTHLPTSIHWRFMALALFLFVIWGTQL